MFPRASCLGFGLVALFTAAAFGAPQDLDSAIAQLETVRLNKAEIYSVRDISINRDVLSIFLNRGVVAFTEAIDGKVTGAVFMGSGDILAIPPDRVERQQLYRYTKTALLNEHFETAVFRFTDNTYEEILKQYREHAQDVVDPADTEEIVRWESEIQRRATYLNDRILMDLLSGTNLPFFMAQIEGAKLGWFDAVYDERQTEEILLQQNLALVETPVVWSSFNKRSEIRDPEAFSHENKSPFEIIAVDDGGTSLRIKPRLDGERVIALPVNPKVISGVGMEDGTPLRFLQAGDHLAVILPVPTRSGVEIALSLSYTSEDHPYPSRFRVQATDALVPAGYRDQWIIEAFAGYAAALAYPGELALARERLLAESPEGGSFESLGSVSIGFRMMQPRTKPGYAEAFAAKSVWILHMLRQILQEEGGATAFGSMVEQIQTEFRGKPISTLDFKRFAEKYAEESLDWFFDSWVFGTGVPTYSLNFKVDPDPGGFAVAGEITQSGVPDTFEMKVPLYADETYLGHVTVSIDGGEFRFVTATKPERVLVDPYRTVLSRTE